jgi:hypothetical protein
MENDVIDALTEKDLQTLKEFVSEKGGVVLANINKQGRGSLPLLNTLLGQSNSFSPQSSNCEEEVKLKVQQQGFVSKSEKKVSVKKIVIQFSLIL